MTGRIRVLCVDDEADLLEIGKMFLQEDGGFSVDTALSAPAALDLFATKTYDVIVSDYLMPDMDGIEFLKKIRASGTSIPFILFTGRGREDVAIEALNNGADFYIQKAGAPEAVYAELIHVINQVTARRKAEEQLVETNTYLTNLITYAGNPIVTWDVNSKITKFNRAFEELTGFSETNLLGKDFDILFPEDSRADSLDLVVRALFGEKWKGVEIPVRTLHGETRTVIWNSANIYEADGTTHVATIAMGTDITKRKQAEEALADNRDYLNQIYSSVQSGIVLIDAKTHEIIDLNPAAERMMGTPKDQIIGRVCHRFICPAEQGRCPITDLHQEVDNSERMMLAAGGEKKDIIKHVVPFRFHGRDCLLETFLDNTERKLAADKLHAAYENLTAAEEELRAHFDELSKQERALRESEEKFRALVENSLDGILITDFKGTLLFSNQAAGRIVEAADYSALFGKKNVLDYVAPESRAAVLYDLGRVLLGIDAYLVHYKLITETKREIWVECIGKKIPFGDSSAMLVSMRDVTERRQAEDALRSSEEFVNTILENIPNMVFVKESDELRFVRFNKAGEELLGYSRKDLYGKNDHDFFPKDEADFFIAKDKEALRIGQLVDIPEESIQTRNKGERILHTKKIPVLDEQKKPRYLLGISEDITERKQGEKALQQANRKLSLLFGITRHDIKNQILVLDGHIALLKRKISDPALQYHLSHLTKTSNQIAAMIQFTKEYEQVGVKIPVWQDLPALVDNAKKNMTFGEVSLKNDLPAGMEIYADPLVSKVFFNLIENALVHGETISMIRFVLERRDDTCVIICEDDGNGIAPEMKEKIFDRGSKETAGFGLSLSREILDITGITIRETGEPGTGARFEITVPKGQCRPTSR